MDFFERQAQARRRTALFLVLYGAIFVVVALALFLLVNVVVYVCEFAFSLDERVFWNWGVFGWFCLGFAGFIGITVGSRFFQLRGGGPAVAEMLRGERLAETGGDLRERQLHNVVEEMAVAAGIPKPDIYVFERELGINSLVAGFGLDDAILGVTRGALEHLDRDEIQGAVAHEFSHLLNGDMRLNLWMICMLHGIFSVHELGLDAVRSTWGDERDPAGSLGHGYSGFYGGVFVFVMGMALIAIGYPGYVLARIVQCALSRQREHLADAAALQFTRYPHGLAGALKKVGGWSRGGRIDHPLAEEAGHVFFVDGISGTLERIFSTHPPIVSRIRSLDPSFDGGFPVILDERARRRSQVIRVPEIDIPAPSRELLPLLERVQVQAIVAAIGQLEASRLERSRTILERIPASLRQSVRQPEGAAAVVLELMQSDGGPGPSGLAPESDGRNDAVGVPESCRTLDRESRLALVELALPALHHLSPGAYTALRAKVDRRISDGVEGGGSSTPSGAGLYALCIGQTVIHFLDRHFGRTSGPTRQIYSIGSQWDEVSVLLGALARAGEKDTDLAWRAALSALPVNLRNNPLPAPVPPGELRRAMDTLHCLSPGTLRRFMNAAVHCVASDGRVSPGEAELIRAFAAALGCPVPPVVAKVRT